MKTSTSSEEETKNFIEMKGQHLKEYTHQINIVNIQKKKGTTSHIVSRETTKNQTNHQSSVRALEEKTINS